MKWKNPRIVMTTSLLVTDPLSSSVNLTGEIAIGDSCRKAETAVDSGWRSNYHGLQCPRPLRKHLPLSPPRGLRTRAPSRKSSALQKGVQPAAWSALFGFGPRSGELYSLRLSLHVCRHVRENVVGSR